MTIFNALVSLNADSRFSAYQPGHRMFTTTALFTTVVADTVEEALDKVWVWGNKMSVEAGRQYPAETRSLSVGDVVTVRDISTTEITSYAVASIGFDKIPEVADEKFAVCKTAAGVTERLRRISETWR